MPVLIPPTPLENVIPAMATLEGANLTSVDSHFTACGFLPLKSDIGRLYPFSFHFMPNGLPDENAESSGSAFFMYVTVNLVILVGPVAGNEFGVLSKQALRYVEPAYALYRANRGISNTVGNTHFRQQWRIGGIPLNATDHYGLVIPLDLDRRLYFPSKR